MKEGDVVLTPLSQADGSIKNRPALLLRELPPLGSGQNARRARSSGTDLAFDPAA